MAALIKILLAAQNHHGGGANAADHSCVIRLIIRAHCGRGYDQTVLDGLFYDVRDSAYRIIEAKGATYFAIAESVKRIVSAIVRDENTILPVSALVDGHYGLEGVYMSLPCIVNRRGIRRVLEIPLNEEEEQLLRRSASKLKAKAEELEELLFQPF
jgi:L-lactate dehydrogenase